MTFTVEQFYKAVNRTLQFKLIAGSQGLSKKIENVDVQLVGLRLAGFLKNQSKKSLLIFGRSEVEFLEDLPFHTQKMRLESFLTKETPAVVLTHKSNAWNAMIAVCEERNIPLFYSSVSAFYLLGKLIDYFKDVFAPFMHCHGCLIDVLGVGVLIQGEPCIGKSDALLGLIENGHRLIADDIVCIKKKGKSFLEGSGTELSRHHMEVRGIGIINIESLYGSSSVSEKMKVDLVIKLQAWEGNHFHDRIGIEKNAINLLGVKLPYHCLPVWPGRNTTLLIKTIVLNYRLKKKGYNSARRFRAKLHSLMAQKNQESCVSYAE